MALSSSGNNPVTPYFVTLMTSHGEIQKQHSSGIVIYISAGKTGVFLLRVFTLKYSIENMAR